MVNIDFVEANNISNKIDSSVNDFSSISSSANGISASAFSSYSSGTVSLTESFKSNIEKIATRCDNLLSSFSLSIELYHNANEEQKKAVEEKIKSDSVAPTGTDNTTLTPSDTPVGTVSINIDEEKMSEIKATTEFYFNYPGNVREVKQLSTSKLSNLLEKNGALKASNGSYGNGKNVTRGVGDGWYLLQMDGHYYEYNVNTSEIITDFHTPSKQQPSWTFRCKFYATEDTSFEDVTNTITLLGGQGSTDSKDGPNKKGQSLFEGVKANKNSVVVVPYGLGYGHTSKFIPEGISGSTRIADFMVGGKTKKINNSIVGYSMGGMSAYRTVANNKGLYNKLVAVNTYAEGDIEKYGGSYDSFNSVEIIVLEASGDKFVPNATSTIKRLINHGVNKNNIKVYSNDRGMINNMNGLIPSGNINDWSKYSSQLKGWSTHNYGIAMIKDSSILNYLSA